MESKKPAVYMVASQYNGTIYCGVTSNLPKRIYEHRAGLFEGFTKKYGCKTLVWYECHATMESAINREKRIKKYPRQWKVNLIQGRNLHWQDLWYEINGLPEQVG